MKPWLPLVLALALPLPATATPAAQPDTATQNLFTLPLDAFQPNPNQPSQRVYRAPGASLKAYRSVLIDPLLFLHQGGEGWQLLEADSQNKIARYFHDSFATELGKNDITVTDKAAPGVMRIRIAVTDLQQERPGVGVLDFIPARAVFNLARLAVGKEPYLVKVGSMAQLEDAQTGALLGGAVNLRESPDSKNRDEPLTLDVLKKLIDDWTEASAQQLARALKADWAGPSAKPPLRQRRSGGFHSGPMPGRIRTALRPAPARCRRRRPRRRPGRPPAAAGARRRNAR